MHANLASIALITFLVWPLHAQQLVEEFPFQDRMLGQQESAYYSSLVDAIRNLEEDDLTVDQKYIDHGDSVLYATLLYFSENFTKEASLTLRRVVGNETTSWTGHVGSVSIYDLHIIWDESTVFYWDDALFVKLIYKAYNDFTDSGSVRFLTASGNVLKSIGIIDLYDRDDPSGERTYELFDGELYPFEYTLEGVKVTILRKELSNYTIEYLLTPEGLRLVKNNRPDFHISTEEADTHLKKIFEHYYSNEWKDKASSSKGKQRRASEFLWQFDQLRQLRSDYAPAYYNMACMLAILDRRDEAVSALKTAFELDDAYKQKAMTDSDLSSLHSFSGFDELFE